MPSPKLRAALPAAQLHLMAIGAAEQTTTAMDAGDLGAAIELGHEAAQIRAQAEMAAGVQGDYWTPHMLSTDPRILAASSALHRAYELRALRDRLSTP